MSTTFLRRPACALVILMLCLAFGVNPAAAQSTTDGAIGGLIKDPNGAVVPNATVTVRNEGTNRESTATSDDEGRFRVVQLQPGNYTVSVAGSGFAPFSKQNVVVEVGRVTSLEIPLAITGSTEQVEVTAEAPVINTTQQDFANNINQTSINELPINGRRASNFVLLTPGVVAEGGFGLNSFRGVSGLLNNSTVDGGDNNNAFYAEERGRTRISYVVSQAAIREFQVNTSNYSAEYGRAAGAVINTVTKSGTNEFHGGAFYYLRNNRFGATNPFTTRPVVTGGVTVNERFKPVDKRHQFGGTIGGPIVKNSLFFFFTYDQQKRDFPGSAVLSNQSFLNDLPATATCATTTVGINRPCLTSRSATLLNNARIDEAKGFISSLLGEVPRTQDQTIFFPKIDWVINSSNNFTASYNRMRSESPAGIQTQPTTTSGRASFGDDFVETDVFNARLTSTISPTLLNEARFQWGRDNLFAFGQEPTAGEQALLPAGATRVPNVFITNGLQFGTPTFLDRFANPDEKRVQFANTMTLTKGSHTLRYGFDFNHVNDLLDNLVNQNGAYSYANSSDFIIDYTNARQAGALRAAGVVCATSTRLAGKCYNTTGFTQGFGPTAFEIATDDYSFFIQDDWRAAPRLTLNLGLRYEYEKLPEPQIPSSLANIAGQAIGPEQTRQFPSDKNNFGPRFGFAYDLTGDGKTSLRAGYGIYYGRIINSTIINAVSNTGVAEAQRTVVFSATDATSPIFPNILTTPPAPVAACGTACPNIVVFSPNMKNPLIHQADIIFEREIAPNTAVSVSYLFSRGRSLPTFVDENLPAPVNATYTFSGGALDGQTITVPFFRRTSAANNGRPDIRFGAITQIRSDIESKYDALVLQLNRRLTKGLQFQTHYTFSRAEDNGQNSQTFTFTQGRLNPFGQELDGEGRSNNDVPHRFVASAVWTPGAPFGLENSRVGRAIFGGWTIAPIFVAQSGNPYTATFTGNLSTNLASTTVSNPIAGGLTGSGGGSRIPLFERNSFRQPKLVNLDLRLSRRFRFTEDTNLEFLAEAFNLFNRYQVTGVNATAYALSIPSGTSSTLANTTLTPQAPFGTVTSAGNSIYRERQVQFAVRFQF
ncbi:MAG TPA: TonB-dependent receptor [Pyrinomonadaceae bacterium]|nr:TonB-dependent receptor [Pyrinomonadaceae bacterium]